MAASTLSKSKTGLGAFYRRMRSRLRNASAITATAHKLARIVYRLLKYAEAYVKQGIEEYNRRYKERVLEGLTKSAHAFGFQLVPNFAPTDAAPGVS